FRQVHERNEATQDAAGGIAELHDFGETVKLAGQCGIDRDLGHGGWNLSAVNVAKRLPRQTHSTRGSALVPPLSPRSGAPHLWGENAPGIVATDSRVGTRCQFSNALRLMGADQGKPAGRVQ